MSEERTMIDWFDEVYTICKDIPLDRLRELADAEREGRVKVLPFNVGSTVHWLTHFGKVVQTGTVHEVLFSSSVTTVRIINSSGRMISRSAETAYKTYAEAECAADAGKGE